MYKRQARIEDFIAEADVYSRTALGIVAHGRQDDAGDVRGCRLYTSDAADDLLRVDLGGRRIINKKIQYTNYNKQIHTYSRYTHTFLGNTHKILS